MAQWWETAALESRLPAVRWWSPATTAELRMGRNRGRVVAAANAEINRRVMLRSIEGGKEVRASSGLTGPKNSRPMVYLLSNLLYFYFLYLSNQ